MKEYSIDNPEVIGRLVLNTDILVTFLDSVGPTDTARDPQASVGALQDLALDLLREEATDIKSWSCVGAYEEPFEVTVWQWGGVYFVSASEFDDRGYFLDYETAEAAARDIADAFPSAEE